MESRVVACWLVASGDQWKDGVPIAWRRSGEGWKLMPRILILSMRWWVWAVMSESVPMESLKVPRSGMSMVLPSARLREMAVVSSLRAANSSPREKTEPWEAILQSSSTVMVPLSFMRGNRRGVEVVSPFWGGMVCQSIWMDMRFMLKVGNCLVQR